jgi:hypothetical protein
LTEEVTRIARAICDGAPRGASHRRHCERSEAIQSPRRGFWIASSASPPRNDESCCGHELAYLARRIAEAQVDLMRVRRARHAMMARALDNPRYRSPRYLRRQIAMLVAVGELLIRGIAVPDAMRKAAFGRPQGALKFALVITDLATQLARLPCRRTRRRAAGGTKPSRQRQAPP